MADLKQAPKGDPKAEAKVAPLPSTFAPDQLFVAVSDNDGPAAGFDGGPERGGSGAWPVGAIRPWTATGAVPLALRDPKDGTIARGYVEPVEELADRNGQPFAVRSSKFFAVRGPDGEWTAASPSPRALQRATRGASSIAKAFAPLTQQGQRLASAGVNL